MLSLIDLVDDFVEIRTKRMALEKEAAALKNGREGELKSIILQLMAAQGLKSANIEGVGRVVCRETSHFEINDIERLAYRMLECMVSAAQTGRPLSDGLLVQRRVHRESLETLMESIGGDEEETARSLGIKKVTKVDLAFTQSS